MYMKRLYVPLVFILVSISASAQVVSSCVQTLRLAQSTYENGRLHELPTMLQGCLDNGFTDEEKRQAYMLLTMAYIYLEEPEQADDAMLNLLRTDHFFEVDANVHPAEFISLYNKFRTKSLFRIGANLGPTFNMASVYSDEHVGQTAAGSGKYLPRVGFQIALAFEKDLLERGQGENKVYRLTIAPEFAYAIRSYGYSGTPFLNDRDESPAATQVYDAKINRFELNPLVKLNVFKKSNLNPHIIVGPGVNLLLKNTLSGAQLNWTNGAGTVTGADIEDYKSTGKQLSFSGILGFGVRYRFGGVFGTLDVRWREDISNFVNTSQRNIPAAQFDYAIASDDFRLTTFSVNLGIQYAYFSPKKLIK